ncbi:hypothetical protein LEP1GSC060_3712 [Leptospira weilii serovar Ranarum str. ICFT]|uniref:Uncharacterized protein n=1 Tax=Leptospira weilii serovar Ranarum str. ICFT TaxID=1218598 RepID=N1WB23_9LEPT|nr:hypothetical protein LEP1GSC060_3712 [Leptospira weilii serovar Ranarum str. ICFT]
MISARLFMRAGEKVFGNFVGVPTFSFQPGILKKLIFHHGL